MIEITDIETIKERIKSLYKKGLRIDGRKFDEFRKVILNDEVSVKAEGSVQVKIGDTEVLVGVKIGLGKPYPDTPNKGNLLVNAEITPLSGHEHESGMPKEPVITMARVVDRGIRESHSIDLESLSIKEGERNYEVFIDAYVVTDDGNLTDACAAGALRALKNSYLPKYDEKTDSIGSKTKSKTKLKLNKEPIAITIVKIGDLLLIDPNKEEMDCAETKLTVTLDEKDKVISLQKEGSIGLSFKEVEESLKMATKHSKNIRKLVIK